MAKTSKTQSPEFSKTGASLLLHSPVCCVLLSGFLRVPKAFLLPDVGVSPPKTPGNPWGSSPDNEPFQKENRDESRPFGAPQKGSDEVP